MKVLIVNDEAEGYLPRWKNTLDAIFPTPILIIATSKDEARKKFQNEGPFDLIAMDACVDESPIDTIDLVQEFRETFKGPMVAISSLPRYQDRLVQAGCSHQTTKQELAQIVIQHLRW